MPFVTFPPSYQHKPAEIFAVVVLLNLHDSCVESHLGTQHRVERAIVLKMTDIGRLEVNCCALDSEWVTLCYRMSHCVVLIWCCG